MANGIEIAEHKAKQYWYVDGLSEIAFGLLCLLLALYFGAEALLDPASFAYRILNSLFVLVIVGGALFGRKLVQVLKNRITYPRTGFVSYRKPKRNTRWLTMLWGFSVSIAVGILFAKWPASEAWMPAVTGIFIGLAWIFVGGRLGLLRFYWMSFFSIAIGVWLSLAGIGNVAGLAVYYGLFALGLFASGGLTLSSYLRETRAAEEVGDGA